MSNITLTLPTDTAPLAGPQLLGTLFNWGLYGVLSMQVYMYHIAFPRDAWLTKSLVYVVYVLDTVQTILVTHDAFTYFASGFGNVETLGRAQLEWLAVPTISGIVSCTVQMYYARRVYILSRSTTLAIFICLVALMQGSAAIAEGALFFIIQRFDDLTAKTFVSCSIWLAGSAACDIIIAGSMTYLLLRKDTKVPETHALVTRLIHLVVETGSLTAITATVDLVLFLVFPDTAYHAAVALTLAKLYSNSMLVILNSRMRIRGGRGSRGESESGAPGTAEQTSMNFATRRSALDTTQTGIHIHESTWSNADEIALEERSSYGSRKKVPDLTPEP